MILMSIFTHTVTMANNATRNVNQVVGFRIQKCMSDLLVNMSIIITIIITIIINTD